MNSEDLNAILRRIVEGNQTDSDIAALRDVLIFNGNQYIVQLGSGNINIGQGRDIKIENNTFNLPEAELIRKFLEKLTTIPHNLAKVRSGAVKFVGRDQDLESLHQQLQDKERIAITAVVTGMAGVGKTELAIQYALGQKQQFTYPGGICWIQVEESNVGVQLLRFAQSQLNLNPPDNWELRERLDYCWSRWQPSGDVLIILDNVRNYEEIQYYLPPLEQRFKVLITTRKLWLAESFEQLRLEVLEEDTALELLASFIGEYRLKAELETSKNLCNWLGKLPLGLELVGRFLKRRPNWTLARMMERLEQQRLESKPLQKISPESPKGVVEALELSWKELDELGKKIGSLLSLFALAPVKWELVMQCQPNEDEEEWEEARDEQLVNLSLIKETEGKTYQLHQLVRQYLRDKLELLPEAQTLKQSF
ncbi:MAG: hypothetical protein F6K65_34165 [Moorea sp. SIO3C2]|nr:hypothetical protein [Moorena sp. SIO3C2]